MKRKAVNITDGRLEDDAKLDRCQRDQALAWEHLNDDDNRFNRAEDKR